MHFPRKKTSGVPLLLYPQQNNKNYVSALVNGDDCESNAVDESAISSFVDNCHSELPTCSKKHIISDHLRQPRSFQNSLD